MNLLSAGPKFTLVERVRRSANSNAGLFVPRRGQEETFGAVVYDPGVKGVAEGLEEGDLVIVRPNAGMDFTLHDPVRGKVNLTALQMDKDEIFAIADRDVELDRREY